MNEKGPDVFFSGMESDPLIFSARQFRIPFPVPFGRDRDRRVPAGTEQCFPHAEARRNQSKDMTNP